MKISYFQQLLQFNCCNYSLGTFTVVVSQQFCRQQCIYETLQMEGNRKLFIAHMDIPKHENTHTHTNTYI